MGGGETNEEVVEIHPPFTPLETPILLGFPGMFSFLI
jgi:hypothetical protein